MQRGVEEVAGAIAREHATGPIRTVRCFRDNQLFRALLDEGIDYFQAYVCENLGSPDERVTQGSLADIAKDSFATPNVMILVRKARVAVKRVVS